eukprot:2109201-Amphidinium_carterae.1
MRRAIRNHRGWSSWGHSCGNANVRTRATQRRVLHASRTVRTRTTDNTMKICVIPESSRLSSRCVRHETREHGDLCMYSGAQAKGDVAMAVQTLSEIQGKMMPARVANPTSFVQSLWLRLPFFAAVERVVAEESEQTKEPLMGQAAVNAMWLSIKSKADADIEQHE